MNIGIGTYPHRRAIVRPEATALEFEGQCITYREFSNRVNRTAHFLQKLGLKQEDRVAFVGFNHPALLETFFGANLIGITPVLINPRLSAAEIDFIITDSEASVVIYGIDLVQAAEYLEQKHPELIFIAVEGAEGPGQRFLELQAAAPPDYIDSDVDEESTALLMYTSGTTGHPKGAMLSHRNLFYNYVNSLLGQDMHRDEVILAVAPLFHIAGLNMITIPAIMKGAKIIIHRSFNAPRVLDEIERSRITGTFMVPAMLDMLAEDPTFKDRDLSSFRTVMVGGSPLSERSLRTWQQRQVTISQGFGMTETAPGVSLLEAQDADTHMGTAGRAHFFTDIRVVDPITGEDVPNGTPGEVWVRGPHVMKGYWNRPEDNAQAFIDDWYKTGDIATRDENGYHTIKDRIKDMYISGGENIYPAEVEHALLNLPEVLDAAVIGVPDQRWGESGLAFVVIRTELLTAGYTPDGPTLREQLGQHLARYKLPREILIIDELPRNVTGKVLKNKLRELPVPTR